MFGGLEVRKFSARPSNDRYQASCEDAILTFLSQSAREDGGRKYAARRFVLGDAQVAGEPRESEAAEQQRTRAGTSDYSDLRFAFAAETSLTRFYHDDARTAILSLRNIYVARRCSLLSLDPL